MAGVTLGFLKYVLGLDTIQFRKGISQSDADLAKMQRSFAAHGKSLQALGKKMTAFATLPLVGSFSAFAKHGIDEAQRMVNAMAQVNAALKSTGGQAGVTGEQLKHAAEQFETHSLFESEDILRDVSARLLAFGSIHGEMFHRAQQDILDYAQRTGSDLGQATKLIGKSLENPVKAAGALFKAGVSLTDGQKALIKQFVETGNAAGAQEVILSALETKYSGAAAAAANVDPYHKMHVAFKQLAETVGNALLPLIPPLTNAITTVINAFTSLSPTTQKWLLIAAGVITVLGPILIVLGNLVIVIGALGPAVTALSTAWTVLQAGLIAARVAAIATLPALVPFLVPLGAIALAVGAVYLAWKNWDKIKAVVAAVKDWVVKHVDLLIGALGPLGAVIGAVVFAFKHWDQIKAIVVSTYNAVKSYLGDKLNAVWDWIEKKVGKVVELFRWMWDKLVGHSYVPDTVDAIATHFGRLQDVMVAPADKATKAVAASFQQLKSDVQSLLDQLFPEIAQARDQLEQLAKLKEGFDAGLIDSPTLIAAQSRVLGADGQVTVDGGVLDQLPGALDADTIDKILPGMGQIVDKTREWKDALGQIGQDLLQHISDDIIGLVTHSMKLKDVWKDLLAFGLNALLNKQSPLFPLIFGGARAAGGPVLSNRAYLVGERGPEIFMPGSSGKIVSNDNSRRMLGGGGMGWYGDMNVYGVEDVYGFNRSEGQVTRRLKRKLARG